MYTLHRLGKGSVPHPKDERLVLVYIFKDMRSIGPLRDRRGWIVSEASKTGVAIFIYTLHRLGEVNVPHPGNEIQIFTV